MYVIEVLVELLDLLKLFLSSSTIKLGGLRNAERLLCMPAKERNRKQKTYQGSDVLIVFSYLFDVV